MDVSTGSWFKYLSEQILTEGLDDIGLPDVVVRDIRGNLPDPVSEKARMWIGNTWKTIAPVGHAGSGVWLARGEIIRDELIAGIEQWTNAVLVNKGLVSKLSIPGKTPLSEEERESNLNALIDYITWMAALQKKLKESSTIAGDYPKTLRKALKSLNKLLLKAEKENLYPFNPKLLEPEESPTPTATIMRGYGEIFEKAYKEFFRGLYDGYKNVFTALNEEPSFYDEHMKGLPPGARLSMRGIEMRAVEFLESREEEDKVINSYDDGTYWYNLGVSKCDLVKERNFNCGDAYAGEDENLPGDLTLIELRYKDPKKSKLKHFKSFVLVAYSPSEDAFYQIKGNKEGQGNLVPRENTWPKIIDLIGDLGVTHIYETGRHSDEEHDYPAFLEHLADQTGVELAESGENFEAMWTEAQQELRNTESQYSLEHAYVEWEEYDRPDDNEVQVRFSGGINIVVPLGSEYERVGDEWVPVDEELRETVKPIPMNSWNSDLLSEAQDIISNWVDDNDVEIDYNIDEDEVLIERAQGINFSASVSKYGGYTGEEVQTADTDYGNFISAIENELDEEYDSYKEQLRLKMIEMGYLVRGKWDDIKMEVLAAKEEGEFEPNFIVSGGESDDSPHKISATFVMNPGGTPQHDTGVIVPKIFKDWNRPHLKKDDLLKVFDAERTPGMRSHSRAHYQLKKESPTYAAIAGALNTLQHRANAAAVQQAELPFGDKYKAAPPESVDMSQFMDILINFAGTSGVDEDRGRIILFPRFAITSDMGAEEAQSGYNLIRWMNKNADQVRKIIIARLKYRVDAKLKEKHEQQTEEIDDDAMMQQIEKVYRDAQQFEIKDPESPNYNPNAVARWLAARWLHVNWHKFTKIEKVAGANILTSMSITGLVPSLELSPRDNPPQEEDFEKGRKTSTWEDKVRMVMGQVGAYETAGMRATDYRWERRQAQGDWRPGMPTPANESIEDQIDRIDKLLQEKDPSYDLT